LCAAHIQNHANTQLRNHSLNQCFSYLLHDLDGRECILQTIAVAVDDALVACGMEVGKAAGVKVKDKVKVEWCTYMAFTLA